MRRMRRVGSVELGTTATGNPRIASFDATLTGPDGQARFLENDLRSLLAHAFTCMVAAKRPTRRSSLGWLVLSRSITWFW